MTKRNAKAKPAVMWAITFPLLSGHRDMIRCAFETRKEAIDFLVLVADPAYNKYRDAEWRRALRQGYRCVKVRVTEI